MGPQSAVLSSIIGSCIVLVCLSVWELLRPTGEPEVGSSSRAAGVSAFDHLQSINNVQCLGCGTLLYLSRSMRRRSPSASCYVAVNRCHEGSTEKHTNVNKRPD